MKTLAAVALRDVRSLFVTPLGWVLLASLHLLLAYAFLAQVDSYLGLQGKFAGLANAPGVTRWVVAQWLANATVVTLLAVPLLTMRLVAEEKRADTFPLLLAGPIADWQIVIGKYLAALFFVLLVLVLAVSMPLSLYLGAQLDLGLLGAGMLGLFMLLASFAAVGLYMSCLTVQPAAAAAGTYGVLLFLWILEWGARGGDGENVLAYLSLVRHYQSFVNGAIDTRDLAYFSLLIFLFLFLSVRRLQAQRRGA
mgnify:CR=1 FL=1